MGVVWSQWRLFPDPQSGIPFDAPAGPGLFEVRHIGTGEQVAFAVSADVANSLATLISPPASGPAVDLHASAHLPSPDRP